MATDSNNSISGADVADETQNELSKDRSKPLLSRAGKVMYRIWRLFAEFSVVIMTLAIAWLYTLSWLLTQQSINISGARSNIGLFFADTVAGAGVDVSSMKLDWYPATDDIVFSGEDISVKSDDGMEIQRLESLKSFFPLEDVRQAIVIPRKVQLVGGVVSWVEDENGRIRAGLGTPETLGRLGPLWEGRRATERRPAELNLDGVQSVDIQGATVFYTNATNGLNLTVNRASLTFEALNDTLDFKLGGDLKQSSQESESPFQLAIKTDRAFQSFDVSYDVENLNPSGVGPIKGRFKKIRDLDASSHVAGAFIFNRQLGLKSADLQVEIGEGSIVVPFQAEPYDFEGFQTVASLDSGESVMDISRFDLISDRLKFAAQGSLSELGKINDGDINSSPLFALNFDNLQFDLQPILEDKVDLASLSLSGHVDIDARTLDVEKLVMDRGTHQFKANLYTKLNAQGGLAMIKSDGAMSGTMNTPEMLDLWPVKFADGARRWIDRAILEGEVNTFSYNAEFIDEGDGLDEKQMVLDFSVSKGTVKYISTMTPMTNVAGFGRVENNALKASITSANIGPVTVLESHANIPRLRPKGGDMILEVNATGQSSDLLSLVNQKPFQFADRYDVNPQEVGGRGQVKLGITRPLLEFFDQNRILYEIEGSFTEATAPFQIGEHRVTQGEVTMSANRTGLKAEGVANIGPWRTNIRWEETFDEGLTPTRYHVFGDMDHAILDEFGFGGREFFDGTIGVDIRATGKGLMLEGGKLRADLTDTEITLADFWTKQKGVDGQLQASLTRNEEGLDIRDIELQAPDLTVLGSLSFTPNFALRELLLNQVTVSDFINGRLSLRPDNSREMLSGSFTGKRLDISTLIDNSLSDQTSTFDVPIIFSGDVEELILDPLFVTEKASFLYSHDGQAMTSVRLSAESSEGDITVNLITDKEKNNRQVEIALPNAGHAARAFLGLDSLKKGRMSIKGTLPMPGEDGAYIGDVVIEDFTLSDAPVLAQLLSLGSLTGLFDTLSGEGLGFDRLEMPFQLLEGVLSVRDAYVYGPALGMTGDGNVYLAEQRVDIDGAIAPAYTANSLLGDIPVLGDIFGGKKGEGVLALSYTVSGPFESTQVAVNPLSAITPGFMRGIFRKDREDITRQEQTGEAEEEPEFKSTPADNE